MTDRPERPDRPAHPARVRADIAGARSLDIDHRGGIEQADRDRAADAERELQYARLRL